MTDFDKKTMLESAARFRHKPTISILMPTYNSDVRWLRRAIESVLSQVYPQWELCIVDDGSSNCEEISQTVSDYARKDKRVKFKSSKMNQGISMASNEALGIAEGEYIALLDHDDEFSPDALFNVVQFLNERPETDMFYSDEDKVNERGKRYDPYFKPDWSPDLFFSNMYTCHLGVYRSSLVKRIGGFRRGFEGAQDYDLVLRMTDMTENIIHIPRVLYHWRVLKGSTAMDQDAKCYAYDAAKKALREALERKNIEGEVFDGKSKGSYRVKRKIGNEPLISIIIPTKDNKKLLDKCINSIVEKTEYKGYELLVINNASQDRDAIEHMEKLAQDGVVKLFHYNKPFNFAAINNHAVQFAEGNHLLFLNDDVEVISGEWLTAMLEHSQREEVGAVGAKLLYPDGRIQHAGIILGIGEVASHSHQYLRDDRPGYFSRKDLIQNVSAVTAACLMTRKQVFTELNGFDDTNLSVAYNDVDFCLRIRERGYLIVYTPYALLYHHESASRGYEAINNHRFKREIEYMKSRWGTVLYNDPYYNPNLTLGREDFSVDI